VAEVEFDFGVVGGQAREPRGDNGYGGAVDAFRLSERRLDRGAIEPDHVSRAFVGAEIERVAIGPGMKDVAEQETLERRDVGGRDRRLDNGRGKIVGHGGNLGERGKGRTRRFFRRPNRAGALFCLPRSPALRPSSDSAFERLPPATLCEAWLWSMPRILA